VSVIKRKLRMMMMIPEQSGHVLAGALGYSIDVWVASLFIDNLLVRIHFIIVMIRWAGLAPWEFEFPFPGSLTSTFLSRVGTCWRVPWGTRST